MSDKLNQRTVRVEAVGSDIDELTKRGYEQVSQLLGPGYEIVDARCGEIHAVEMTGNRVSYWSQDWEFLVRKNQKV